MVFLIGINFALRSGDEHRQLTRSQLALKEDQTSGREYVEYTENVSKSNQRGLAHHNVERKVVRAYSNTDIEKRCIVTLYKKYLELCPAVGDDGPFYLQPLKRRREDQWYSMQPVGRNSLGNTVKHICEAAGIEGMFGLLLCFFIITLIGPNILNSVCSILNSQFDKVRKK